MPMAILMQRLRDAAACEGPRRHMWNSSEAWPGQLEQNRTAVLLSLLVPYLCNKLAESIDCIFCKNICMWPLCWAPALLINMLLIPRMKVTVHCVDHGPFNLHMLAWSCDCNCMVSNNLQQQVPSWVHAMGLVFLDC